jgi:DNA-binding NarL/FixJ family response regulator
VRNESQVVRISDWEAVEHFYEMGNTMDDPTNPALLLHGTHKSPVLVIIEHHMLARTCMLNLLRRELTGVEIVELATSSDLDCVSERDVRLVALNIGDKPIVDPSIEDELTLLERSCPNASIALLSSRDDEATASAAMQRGVRGFFPTSIPVEVAIAGLRLVLAGGVYRPLSILKESEMPRFETTRVHVGVSGEAAIHHISGTPADEIDKPMIGLTRREQHVLAGLELGLPNKLIAARLNLSENTIKMHIQHIMRKCSARNRTEAVLRCSGRLPPLALSRVSSSG